MDATFCYQVLCHESVLNTPERVDWKQIQMAKDGEVKMVEKFREIFASYDFTQQEE